MKIQAYAAKGEGTAFIPFDYDPGKLGPEEVEIQVEACGICHSDLSVWKNEWGNAEYPFVGGHEIAGIVSAVGSQVRHVEEGQRVGLGWFARSCMGCEHCLAGDHNLCVERKDTIIGRYGGFADRVRCHWAWAIPLPDAIDTRSAGLLFCGGITVFNPIIQYAVRPTDRVGVVGIGGLGHLALQLLDRWGCDVTAFTSSPGKVDEAKKFGADRVVSSHDDAELVIQRKRNLPQNVSPVSRQGAVGKVSKQLPLDFINLDTCLNVTPNTVIGKAMGTRPLASLRQHGE